LGVFIIKPNLKNGISLKDQVYQKIIEMICNGQLPPDTIFTESQMIELFKVSKSPVREALIQLCHEEVLKSIPRCGYQVVSVSIKSIRDLTVLRLYLELSSLPKVIENITDEKIEFLKLQNKQRIELAKTNENIWAMWRNNVNFHISLVDCAGNDQVTKAVERALSTCTRAFAQLYTVQSSLVYPDTGNFHDLIVDDLERRSLDDTREHLERDIHLMEKTLLYTSGEEYK
jgi:DNA-binding GntR family transcriptional regulator